VYRHIRPQIPQILNEVIGKTIVVIDQNNHLSVMTRT
jgi:hypothetical protein